MSRKLGQITAVRGKHMIKRGPRTLKHFAPFKQRHVKPFVAFTAMVEEPEDLSGWPSVNLFGVQSGALPSIRKFGQGRIYRTLELNTHRRLIYAVLWFVCLTRAEWFTLR